MDFDYKNILIYGYGKSGKAVENVLKDIGKKYMIFDKKMKINGGYFLSKLSRKIIKQFDLIVISPAIPIDDKMLKIAENTGIKIIGELEFGFWFTSADVIAVTGTNGKTTTTHLINLALNKLGFKAGEYGNIGNPLTEAYKKDLDYIVCEVSSFQLESTDKFAPYVSVLTNISQDHLNRHKTFEKYVKLKQSIFKNSDPSDIAILNGKDEICKNIAKNISGKVVEFNSEKGYHEENGTVYFKCEKMFELNDNIKKYTYIENILACISVLDLLGLNASIINELQLDETHHRMEKFLTYNGVEYINDSKATNPHSTLKALGEISGDIVLLLGGSDKDFDFTLLVKSLPENVRKIITFGQAGKKIHKICKKFGKSTTYEKTLQNVINHIDGVTKFGDTVLLSPACASFDEFLNYEERGDFFKKSIENMVRQNENIKNN